MADSLGIAVIGASGDLARRKIFPALFALHCQGFLPAATHIFGFSRSRFSDDEFRSRVAENLTCRYVPGEKCADRMEEFLGRCYYVAGDYGSTDAFLDLYRKMKDVEGPVEPNRVFYLAIPPSVFLDTAHAIGGAGFVRCEGGEPWSRVVIEKPFGRDRETSDALTLEMGRVFNEDQTYRIDHYLGKEVIQNLLVLRFANLVFEPLWDRRYVENVTITWKEDLTTEGRGGYFDEFGIIRDVMQNHLLQILSLVAMEPPSTFGSRDVRDAKVAALRCVVPAAVDDMALGQYTRGTIGGRDHAGYTGDETVPDASRTATYAAVALKVESPRWQGVPFLVRAGKGLDSRMTEIRIRFRGVAGNMFCDPAGCPDANELVIRVQPDEAITFRIVNKVPGAEMRLAVKELDLRYKAAFSEAIPDAYENLLLDVLQGEKGLFIRGDELAAAWDIFTPALHRIDAEQTVPEPYAFGSTGPSGATVLARRHGVVW